MAPFLGLTECATNYVRCDALGATMNAVAVLVFVLTNILIKCKEYHAQMSIDDEERE